MQIPSMSAVLVLAFAVSAFAQLPSRNTARETLIEQQLAAIAPDALPAFQNATRAVDRGDYPEAIRLYREVLARAPTFSPARRRLGASLAGAGNLAEGLRHLEQAVAQQRSPENLIGLAQTLAFPGANQASTEADKHRALALAQEANRLYTAKDDSWYPAIVGHLALELQREGDFREAAGQLAASYPDDMTTHYFAALVAAMDGNWRAAEREILVAERLGLPAAAVQPFLDSGVRTGARLTRAAIASGYLLAAWAAGLLILFAAGRLLSRATLRSIERADPNQATAHADVSLRRIYSRLVDGAALYYYVSLPFVAFLVIGVSAGITYGFLLLGRVPIQLVLTIAIAALVTVVKMLQSLLIKIEATDPGRTLEESEAPALWALARDVAQTVGTRAVDEIRVTPGTELAVYERGSFRQRRRDEGHRVLVLGVGLLNGFRRGAFRAVLAHEYGHFSHRDTAGGDVALRVRQDMLKFAIAMAQQGQAVWWNIAFQFLRVYDFLFRRISHGATRLQEVLADRVAAQKYGAAQFEEGLRHVIRRSIEFEATTRREVQRTIELQRTMQNLYDLRPLHQQAVDHLVDEAVARPTTEDDTHPGPIDRFRYVHRVTTEGDHADAGPLWDLFANPQQLTAEMTAAIESGVREVQHAYS